MPMLHIPATEIRDAKDVFCHINASGKRPRQSVGFEILAISRYEASKTSPSSGWVVVHRYSRYGYAGTIMHVYP